ncbi:histidine kinase [Cohnella suwonensis]|uniref:histidine kinase n=1 Tax=Cohnella suwonensis TaxID=696072 RepID=A0ABW0LZW9_9BACL
MAGIRIRNHLPFLRAMTALLGMLILVGWCLIALGRNDPSVKLLPRDGWRWAPAASFSETVSPAEGWLPYSEMHAGAGQDGAYWLSVPLPADFASRDPRLFVYHAVALSVYDGDRLLYTYDPNASHDRLNLFYHWNLAPLPAKLPSEIRLLLDNRGHSRPELSLRLVGKGELFSYLIRRDAYSFVLSGLFLFSAVISVGLFTIRKDKLHLYFTLLALCGCYASMVRNALLQLFWDQPWLSFMELTIFPLGVYGFINIMIEVFDAEHTFILRRIRWAILGFTAVTLFSALFLSAGWFNWLLSYPLLAMFLVTAAFILNSIRSAYRTRQGPESVWMLAGFFIVTSFALIHVLRTYLPSFYSWLRQNISFLSELPFDTLSVALFLFLVCLIRVIVYRFGQMNLQLKAFNESLESSVEKRTAELRERETQLQEAGTRLAMTARGTAEAIASSMVLEERHRMTGTIHDTIGHALTATIVQLEAAKRLLSRDGRLALEKLEASQGLVRRGMEEIRGSVRLLSDDSTSYDLVANVEALIAETEQSTGATIERNIHPLPASLSTLKKRVLYQALQEGLTNGLRHGGSSRFRFSLHADGEAVRFRLVSDGRTYTPSAFGFGLKAMSERVEGLGGKITVTPGAPGCVLALVLPVNEPSDATESAERQAKETVR